MVNHNPKVIRIQLKQNLNAYWSSEVDNALVRLSGIDLRDANNDLAVKVCCVVPLGVFVKREGYLGKLIPWSNIDDVDIEGAAPGFEQSDVLSDVVEGMPSGANAQQSVSHAAKAANAEMPILTSNDTVTTSPTPKGPFAGGKK